MNRVICKKASLWLAVLTALCLIPALCAQRAFAVEPQSLDLGTVSIDLTTGEALPDAEQAEAAYNVLEALIGGAGMYGEEGKYDLDNSGSTDVLAAITSVEGTERITFSESAGCDICGTWSMDIPQEIQDSLAQEGKGYCEVLQIVFADTEYGISVGGVAIKKSNSADVKEDGTVSYDPENKTLTLRDATLDIAYISDGSSAAVYSSAGELNIRLEGSSRIILDPEAAQRYVYGIYSEGDLNFSGNGSLDIAIDAGEAEEFSSCGINAEGYDMILDGCSITIDVKTYSSSAVLQSDADGVEAANLMLKNGAYLSAAANKTGSGGGSVFGLRVTKSISADKRSWLESLSESGYAVYTGSGEDYDKINQSVKRIGAKVNTSADASGATEWNKETGIGIYKYVGMPLDHIHAWDSGVVTREPTSSAPGEMLYTCAVCRGTKTEPISNEAERAAAEKAAAERAAKYTPGRVKIKKVKKGSKKGTATWKTMKNVTGYQIRFTSVKDGSTKTAALKQTAKISKKKTASKTVKKLKKKTRYRVQVRAYVVAEGETFYGPWSKTKSLKTR